MRWLVTPQFFEEPEPALARVAPAGTPQNAHDLADRSPESLARLHQPIADFVAEGAGAVSVTGDCCAALPVLAGLQRAGIAAHLVWIDAHGDFNTPETSPSGFLGGMPLAMMVGRGPQWMMAAVGARPMAESAITLVDARDLDPMEREAVEASDMARATMDELGRRRIPGPIWVHLDVDVLDADEVGAFKYPVSGGPSVAEAETALQSFAAAHEIAAVSVSGWSGALDPDRATEAACGRLIAALT
ncbi:MAG: arginase family protein [Pseudomonadota bacterium]